MKKRWSVETKVEDSVNDRHFGICSAMWIFHRLRNPTVPNVDGYLVPSLVLSYGVQCQHANMPTRGHVSSSRAPRSRFGMETAKVVGRLHPRGNSPHNHMQIGASHVAASSRTKILSNTETKDCCTRMKRLSQCPDCMSGGLQIYRRATHLLSSSAKTECISYLGYSVARGLSHNFYQLPFSMCQFLQRYALPFGPFP